MGNANPRRPLEIGMSVSERPVLFFVWNPVVQQKQRLNLL